MHKCACLCMYACLHVCKRGHVCIYASLHTCTQIVDDAFLFVYRRYTIIKQLGAGTYGKVVLCEDHKYDKALVAVKLVRNTPHLYRLSAKNEVRPVWCTLCMQHILSLLILGLKCKYVSIMSYVCDQQSLWQLLSRSRFCGTLTDETAPSNCCATSSTRCCAVPHLQVFVAPTSLCCTYMSLLHLQFTYKSLLLFSFMCACVHGRYSRLAGFFNILYLGDAGSRVHDI